MFVCGLQEGEFPLPGSSRAVSAPTSAGGSWPSARGCGCAPSEDALARERYLFYACISRATEQLILSYRSSDEEGNLELPSPFLADVEDLLVPRDGRSAGARRLLADVVWAPELAPTAARARSQPRVGGAPRGRRGRAATARSERRRSAHVRHREIVSAGALEMYAACPVRWLVERELAPSVRAPTPTPLARGSYMH